MRSEMKPFNLLPVKPEKRELDELELRPSASKRSKLSIITSSSPQSTKCTFENNEFPIPLSVYSLLEEPSPIGLRLKKSPSFEEIIQKRLYSDARALSTTAVVPRSVDEKDARGTITATSTEKTKASNFGATLLRIGSWEFVSRYNGDLVAKCYYAKHKLVWEILQGSLKNKMEIQWSDIMALQADCPDGGPGTMTIALSRPPMFYRESEPQPRKHTLWQRSSDFTNGQASIHVKHCLEFPPGVLNKHYEKLIQCDARLKHLSLQPKTVIESMLFFTQDPQREGSEELGTGGHGQYMSNNASSVSCFSDGLSPSITEISSLNYEQMDTGSSVFSREAASPSTVLGTYANEEISKWKYFDSGVPGLRPSMSMTDLVNHIENRISDQLTSGNIPKDKAPECQHILQDISEVLLSDNHHSTATSDEKSLMKRVNSLFNLLQDPATISSQVLPSDTHNIAASSDEKSLMKKVDSFLPPLQVPPATTPCSMQQMNEFSGFCDVRDDDVTDIRDTTSVASGRMQETDISPTNVNDDDLNGNKQTTSSISRKDSFVDLLFQLPRIASLSKLLSDISEDGTSES